MVKQETLNLVHALLQRKDVLQEAAVAFRTKYPDAPQQMIDTAVYHVFTDGIAAVMEWVAEVELFLRSPNEGLSYGKSWHVLYHIYNWHMFKSVLPVGRTGILERLEDIKTFVASGDNDAAVDVVKQLEELFQGDVENPI